MSAFLKYSQKRRQEVKEANPEMNNTDISRLLGEMWRAAEASEKEPYVESEKVERAMYNAAIATWREEQGNLDAASRTSHHSVQQHSVEKNFDIEPPVKKKRRDNYRSSTSDSSRAVISSQAMPVGNVIDRRIFRSYSGSSHPVENKPYTSDQRKYHSSHYSADSSYNSNSEPNSYYHHKLGDTHPYKSEPVSTSVNNGMNTIHPVEYPSRHHPNTYRPTYPPIPLPQGENRHTMQLPNTGSDLFDHPFHDPDHEPPFNPRQTRPSSHYSSFFYP
jgi:HMG (high mobility group) box